MDAAHLQRCESMAEPCFCIVSWRGGRYDEEGVGGDFFVTKVAWGRVPSTALALAHLFWMGRMSLFCWLVWTLLPSNYIITQEQLCHSYIWPVVALIEVSPSICPSTVTQCHVCMYGCLYVCMCLSLYVCLCVCVCTLLCLCTSVHRTITM